MPELPEVETIKRNLNILIKNKKIKNIIILRDGIICEDKEKFKKTLIKQKIISIERIGKFLIFILENDFVLITHLRMEGKYIFGKNKKEISKYARIIFLFEDGNILNYDDSRIFGKMYIRNKNNYLKIPPISTLGPEAIKKINANNFFNLIKKKRKCIKSVLLDQKIISGIGNIYATEILFESGISPFKKCTDLTKEDTEKILKNAKKILLLAIKENGSSTSSFVDSNNKKGNFQNFLKIYGKANTLCPKCKKNFLVKKKICNRGTTFCEKCQK